MKAELSWETNEILITYQANEHPSGVAGVLSIDLEEAKAFQMSLEVVIKTWKKIDQDIERYGTDMAKRELVIFRCVDTIKELLK